MARIVANSSKFNVAVSVSTKIVGSDDPRRPMCAGTTHPCRGVERLQITVNKRSLFVPTSLFFDLADLSSGQMNISGNEIILLLKGGDASESYGVKIRFNADRVLARTLFSSLSPDEPLQETIYHEVALD